MELIDFNEQRLEKWTFRIALGIFYLAALFSMILLCYFMLAGSSSSASVPSCFPTLNKASLGSGPLSLETYTQTAELQPILQELILIGANTRPDLKHLLTFALRSSGERKTIGIGETLFLEQNQGIWSFSESSSNTTLTPYSFDKQQILCKIKNGSIQTESSLCPSLVFSKSLEKEPYIKQLQEGNVWGADVFLAGWGGEDYRLLAKKIKVSLGSAVFFLKTGDCLWWDGERWAQDVSTTGPIAQLIRTSKGAEFQIWDETGFSSEKIQLSLQIPKEPVFDLTQLMTAPRPRSTTEISCLLGKRRVIVKEGDWWIRTENRWKQVRTTADLEACLYHKLSGELFLFETIETSKGKIVVKGQAFDRMRTTSTPISLVVQTTKSRSRKGHS